ncbi:MAG: cation:proton antiporter [Salinivirgaceae bacterium]
MHNFSIPITEPIIVFTLVLLIVLLTPVLLRKTIVPSIVGLIVIGIIIGPHATNLVANNDTIDLFSHVGLLYIMFLAGLEIEITSFLKNRSKSILFGILTFLLPFLFGYFGGLHLLNLQPISAVMIGIMLASNTLIAFPSIGRLGITKTTAINVAVSGTVIADTIVLIILAFVSSHLQNTEGTNMVWTFLITFTVFLFTMFYLLPKLCRWFFKNITSDGNLQFLFTLSVLFASSFLAEMAGAEPIIGAFFAGLSLNRLIPATSTLMNRIDFVGNALFIPFFLISVGMMVDLQILATGYLPALYAALLITLGLGSKWLAAFATKLVFKLTNNETNTIFALTSARTAATLAVAMVGKNYGVINEDVFNSIILLILATSLFSSFFTEKAGILLAKEEKYKTPDAERTDSVSVLVPIANPKNIEKLTELATLITDKSLNEPIYPLSIVKDTKNARKRILANQPIIDDVQKQAAANGAHSHKITRVDVNIPTAIARVSKELDITDIIMGWTGRTREVEKLFSNMLEAVLRNTTNTVIVSHLPRPIQLTKKVVVYVASNADIEPGFRHWGKILKRLSSELSAPIVFHILSEARIRMERSIKREFNLPSYKIIEHSEWPDFRKEDADSISNLTILVNARLRTVSFNRAFHRLTYQMPETFKNVNILNIYTQQFN